MKIIFLLILKYFIYNFKKSFKTQSLFWFTSRHILQLLAVTVIFFTQRWIFDGFSDLEKRFRKVQGIYGVFMFICVSVQMFMDVLHIYGITVVDTNKEIHLRDVWIR